MIGETSKPDRLVRVKPPVIRRILASSAYYLDGGLNWLVNLRWVACGGLFFVIWFVSGFLDIVPDPLPLYLLGLFLVGYNLFFWFIARKKVRPSEDWLVRILFLQITVDLMALTLLLYFSGISHNPFIFYFVFHIIIAGILLPETLAYLEAIIASGMVGTILLLQYQGLIPEHALNLWYLRGGASGKGIYLLGKFIALSSALLFAVYFTVSVLKNVRYAEAEIRQKEKFLGLGQLVSAIIHQIKNPLDGLKNCLHHVKNGPPAPEGSESFIMLMREELERIERLTYRLQDYARPHGIDIQAVDVNREINAALRLLEIQVTNEVKICSELEQVPKAKGDPYALQEVVINLCTNAVDAMPDGGMLTIHTYPTSFKLNGAPGSVAVEVTDTGEGLGPEELDLVFEPFYTTKPPTEGTGLGLWICQMLVSQMGGSIEVTSTPGKGSTFKVMLKAE